MSKFNSTLSAERCRDLLNYDPETGTMTLRVKTSIRTPAGTLVGSDSGRGYLRSRLDGVTYRVHRLVWLWVYGEWPCGELDHINGDKTDNRIANLRDVSRGTNNQNLKGAQRNNRSSGLLGAYRKGVRWQAQIMVNGVGTTLGTFDTPEEAHAAYLEAKRLFHPGCTI